MPEVPGLGALNLKLLCIDWEFLRTLGCCGSKRLRRGRDRACLYRSGVRLSKEMCLLAAPDLLPLATR